MGEGWGEGEGRGWKKGRFSKVSMGRAGESKTIVV